MKNVKDILSSIGVKSGAFDDCNSLQEEFAVIKKAYFRKILVSHPDKGGDPEIFRHVQTSFVVLRDMFTNKSLDSFTSSANVTAAAAAASDEYYDEQWKDFGDMPPPSWDYYYAAAQEEVPIYRVEPAKSNRSKCTQKSKTARKCTDDTVIIEKGELRCGWMDKNSGSYGRWMHLNCWRVPHKVWVGLPNPDECEDVMKFQSALLGMNELLFCGINELSKTEMGLLVEFVMDRGNWAKATKKKDATDAVPVPVPVPIPVKSDVIATADRPPSPAGDAPVTTGASTAVALSRNHFKIPVPGKDGTHPSALQGKTVVLTGVFPEVGGGAGLGLGKDKVKKMVQSFGGKVTGSISGKTDFLIVGKEPGFSKVSKARARPKVQCVSLKDMKEAIETGHIVEQIESTAPPITNFSSGYKGNSLARLASSQDIAVAAGTVKVPPQILVKEEETERKPKKATKKKNSKATKSETNKKNDICQIPSPKKRKAPPGQKKDPTTVVQTEKPKNKNKRAPKKKRKVKQEEEEEKFKITCDECGKDCTELSYLVSTTEEDFCEQCLATHGKHGVKQSNGITL